MEDYQELVEGLALELRRGTTVLAALNLLETPRYGYALIELMAERGVAAEANTLYPLLRRLERQGLLYSRWETDAPKPRKYYEVTPLGRTVTLELARHWRDIVSGMERIITEEGNSNDE